MTINQQPAVIIRFGIFDRHGVCSMTAREAWQAEDYAARLDPKGTNLKIVPLFARIEDLPGCTEEHFNLQFLAVCLLLFMSAFAASWLIVREGLNLYWLALPGVLLIPVGLMAAVFRVKILLHRARQVWEVRE